MRKDLPLIIAAACLATGPAIATAAPTTISFVSIQVKATRTTTGFSIRDNDVKGTTKIGHDTLVCTYGKYNTATCAITVSLAKGTIRGKITLSPSTTSGPVDVIGGTGAYKGATGAGSFRHLNKAGTRTAVSLRLR